MPHRRVAGKVVLGRGRREEPDQIPVRPVIGAGGDVSAWELDAESP